MKLITFVVAVLYGLFMRLLFGFNENFMEVLSVGFIFVVPLGVGALTVRFSKIEKVKSRLYCFFMPWATTFAFLVVSILLAIEGWICWVIMYPIFAIMAGIGGLLMRWFLLSRLEAEQKERTFGDTDVLDDGTNFHKNGNLPALAFMFLPLLVAVLEKQVVFEPKTFTTYSHLDIRAADSVIWPLVVRVTPIGEAEAERGINAFLGMPRPIRAELDTLAVGGRRRAIFDKGLVFDEIVFEYEARRRMAFTIDADPREIPPTAMDEHIIIGGKYFDVLEGRYELEPLADSTTCRLHLTSRYVLHSPMNWYAGFWAQWIMADIQESILGVLKRRTEQ